MQIFNIPTLQTILCPTVDKAIQGAIYIGFSCVAKLQLETITRKSVVGGVILNLESTEDVRKAWNSIKRNVESMAGADDF